MPRPKRAVLYCRISEADDASTSTARQERDLRERAEREGWEVVEVLVDEGLSGGSRRAKADAALKMLADGEADVLAVWKFDRWSRQGLGAVAALIETLDARGASALFVAHQDGLTSTQAAWRIIAAVLAETARMEREAIQTRVRSSIAGLKRRRRYSGGTVPYGYRPMANPLGAGRVLTVNLAEAEVVRDAAERILGGTSAYAVIRDLNERGIPTRRGVRWSVQSLTQILTSDAILGRVTHLGELLRGDDGLPEQVWEPVLPIETVQRLRALLDAPAPVSAARRRREDARLLSGTASCGHCAAPLYVRKNGKGLTTYSCSAKSNGRDCPGLSVSAERIEEYVAAQFLERLGDAPEVVRQEADTDETELKEVEQSIARPHLRLWATPTTTRSLHSPCASRCSRGNGPTFARGPHRRWSSCPPAAPWRRPGRRAEAPTVAASSRRTSPS
jgi:site-specific DNA recombinase